MAKDKNSTPKPVRSIIKPNNAPIKKAGERIVVQPRKTGKCCGK